MTQTLQPVAARFGDLERRFAELMLRVASRGSPELMAAACLASEATAKGDVCVELDAFAGGRLANTDIELPQLRDWLSCLFDSGVVGRPGEYRPLIADDAGRLYLYRYWDYERRVAEHLLGLAKKHPPEATDETLLQAGLARLFPDPQDRQQKIAAAVAVVRRLTVISGGPGTGKTTTVVKVVALLAEQVKGRPLRVALAAPTGKAAARAREAALRARDRLELDAAALASIPDEATTVHRLLGAQPGSTTFRHDRDHPLALDVLVVDEASMVDLALMAKLLDALPAHARLLLLGDKDQLASVEAGAVLGEICAQSGFTPPFAARLARLTAGEIGADRGSPLGDSIVLLDRSYRFASQSGIAKLAHLINQGDSQGVLDLLASGEQVDLVWQSPSGAGRIRERLAPYLGTLLSGYWRRVGRNATPVEVFAEFNRVRVLCAHREGPAGALEANRIVERDLAAQGLIDFREPWYAGRPVMITRNDYNLQLFNGDIGIALPSESAEGALRVFFPTAEGGMRAIHPTRLPEHETVYAMTIHKSQGSEFDEVVVLLPSESSPVVSRELLYTAVTRARARVEIWSSEAVLRDAVARRIRRTSGLRERLSGSKVQ